MEGIECWMVASATEDPRYHRCITHHSACECREAKVQELVRRAGKIADHVLENTVASAHHYEARMVRAAIEGVKL